MIIEWTLPALDDMQNIKDFIAKDSPFYAEQFIERIFEYVEHLADQPKMGRKVPEEPREDVRELLYRDYRIIYRLNPDLIEIAAVIRGCRSLDELDKMPWE